MYYTYVKNVYLVEGAVSACFYDLNSSKLYSLNNELVNFIKQKALMGFTDLTYEETKMLDTLVEAKLLEPVAQPKQNTENINSIKYIPQISFAWIELTQRCNLKCIHCYEESSPGKDLYMSIEDFMKVIEAVSVHGVKEIQLIGGEPLLHKDLDFMILEASKRFDQIEIFTNGTLINDNFVDLCQRYKINVALSVYSYEESEHNRVTKSNFAYKQTMSGIKKLKEGGIHYRVACLNMKGISKGEKNTDLFDLCRRSKSVVLTGRASMELYDENLVYKKLITKESFKRPLDLQMIKRILSGHNCFSNRIYIDCELNVFPCVMERRIMHGSLKNTTLDQLLNRDIINMNKDIIDDCKECEFRYTCLDCRPDAINDNIFGKPWYCTYSPKTGEWKDKIEIANQILGGKKC